jgi:hypothetical protein
MVLDAHNSGQQAVEDREVGQPQQSREHRTLLSDAKRGGRKEADKVEKRDSQGDYHTFENVESKHEIRMRVS